MCAFQCTHVVLDHRLPIKPCELMLDAIIIALLAVASGMSLGLGTDARVLSDLKLKTVVAVFGATALTSLGAIAISSGLSASLRLPFMLIGSLAAGTTAPLLVSAAKGDEATGARSVALFLVSGLVVTPVGLHLLDFTFSKSVFFTLALAGALQTAPIAVGVVLRVRRWRYAANAKRAFALAGNVLLALVVVASAVRNGHMVLRFRADVLLRLLGLFALTAAAGTGLGLITRSLRASIFATTTRNLTTALLVQTLVSHDEEATMLLLVFGLLMYVLTTLMAAVARLLPHQRTE